MPDAALPLNQRVSSRFAVPAGPHTELAFCKLVGGRVVHKIPVSDAIDWLERAHAQVDGDWAILRHQFGAIVADLRSRAGSSR